ncbi:flagellar hook-length control protein FliK [Pseudoalteromonas luteoviolacea]|uniref:flagellar hook-length control protein FliK n=1 Tax=Pseudoalteromonas luteoviolacea TaxID=43657 RepID=UPI001F1A4622|nr:flagellar hook-length control protein FliK [Pseudoalteromonas luteoviolacea]MCF6440384.1 flagellar hook-length control protein FliK [Pseudoalteromonas luteoviolacea]
MANVSLDVGLNNSVAPQHRQADERSAEQGFMAVLAQANEQEEAKRVALASEAKAEVQRRQHASQSEKVEHEPSKVQTGPDEPLKLDDSHLPKTGPDVVLQVEISDDIDSQQKETGQNPDSLLSQITASNNQKTDVEHHLAPVPTAMREHVDKVEVLPGNPGTNKGKKGPIDLIGPIVTQGEKAETGTDALADNKSASSFRSDKLLSADIPQQQSQQTGSERFKAIDPGPRYSEGPVGDPSNVQDDVKKATNNPQSQKDIITGKEIFNGEVKSREWFLHNKNATSDKSEVQKQIQPDVAIKAVKTDSVDAKASTEPKVQTELKTALNDAAKSVESELNSEASYLASQIRKAVTQEPQVTQPKGTVQAQSIDETSSKTDLTAKASTDELKAKPAIEVATQGNEKGSPNIKVLSELKSMVEQLSPQEKKQLESALNEKLSSDKMADPQVKRLESTLYTLVTGKPAPDVNPKQAKDTSNNEHAADKLSDSKVKLSNAAVELPSQQIDKSEMSYNSTKIISIKEGVVAEPTKQNVDVALSEEAPEMATESDGEQSQNNSSNQRQTASANVENIFKAIRTLGSEQIQSKEEFENVIQQVEQSRQSQQVVQQQSAAQVKTPQEQGIMQTLNLARNDAAKMMQEKVNMMINLNNQEAEIRLDPAELGSMQIRIRSDAEQAQINFVVQNQQAKELLEESMPKLKEMLEEQGIQLGDSSIEQQSEGNSGDGDNEQNAQGKLANESSEAQNNKEQSVTSRKQSDSAIDYYA